MIWNEIWDFVKRNIFAIVLIVTLVIAVPWSLIFVLPIAFIFLLILIVLWRVRRQQQQIFDEARRANGDFDEQQKQSHNSWWRRSKNEGEVTIVRTEPTEQRVSDDVGEYVEFKEVKNEETKQ
jgi:FtsZ-interacting cell division protein ZipA